MYNRNLYNRIIWGGLDDDHILMVNNYSSDGEIKSQQERRKYNRVFLLFCVQLEPYEYLILFFCIV